MQDATTETPEAAPNLLTRDDTFFGVCQGLGEDLGVSPNWFRIGFALSLFFSPVGAMLGYAAAGVLVLASRLLIPGRRRAPKAVAQAAPAAPAGANDARADLPLAA